MRGIVVADSIEKVEINIVNITKQLGTTNNQQGEFSLAAEEGDQILFSSLPYETYEIKVTSAMLSAPRNVIYLAPKVNELPEVDISDLALRGFIEYDADLIEIYPELDTKKLGLPQRTKPVPTQAQRKLYTATTAGGISTGGGAGLSLALDPIINIMSGRLAMLAKMRRNEIEQEHFERIKDVLPKSFYTLELELPDEKIIPFLEYCLLHEDFSASLLRKNKLDLVDFFTLRHKEYDK
ncbi:hypothetical protein GCM10009117_23540 [Gangjinia marincola]|uniref:Uncharacterized protein n=1 Tax=Gangjinia marincola TaxID=578463 RepID=A0ABN1MIZ3_9FLAO